MIYLEEIKQIYSLPYDVSAYSALATAFFAAASTSLTISAFPELLAVKNEGLELLVFREVSRIPHLKDATKKDCSRGYPLQTMHRRIGKESYP